MRISTFFYCLKQGFTNIWRNKLYSLASIATIGACIFMFGVFFCLLQNFTNMVKEAESGVAITVFFNEGVSDAQIQEIGQLLEDRIEVSEVKFVSADETWESFKEDYFADNPELAEGFVDDNPLVNSAHYEIYLYDVAEQESLVTYVESMEGVRKVNKSEAVANVLSDFNTLLGYVSIGIIGLLLAVSIFLISNTVMMGITSRKEEIGIMKLIGATNGFVRTPFLIEGILIGLIGAAIPLGILYYLYGKLTNYILSEFDWLTGMMKFMSVNELFKVLLPVGLALGVGIGFFGSIFTTKKHLKV